MGGCTQCPPLQNPQTRSFWLPLVSTIRSVFLTVQTESFARRRKKNLKDTLLRATPAVLVFHPIRVTWSVETVREKFLFGIGKMEDCTRNFELMMRSLSTQNGCRTKLVNWSRVPGMAQSNYGIRFWSLDDFLCSSF